MLARRPTLPRLLPALMLLLLWPARVRAHPTAALDGGGGDDLRAELEDLQRRHADLLALVQALQARLDALGAAPVASADEFHIPVAAPPPDATSSGRPHFSRLGQSTTLGGYIDLEYRDPDDAGDRAFDQHRFVPFLEADISERLHLAAELEIEHGSELEVEFAQVDIALHEAFNLRAGVQLLPLGRLNEMHDAPLLELTDRPLVDRYIIPTTLRDMGLGFFGQLGDTLRYQAAITNGFKGLRDDGSNVITPTAGLRNAAPQKEDGTLGVDPFESINDHPAASARLGWQPWLGAELGVSALFDRYDEAGDNNLRILALDATLDGRSTPLLPDDLELLYEGAWASVQRDAFARASGVAGDMRGYYVQAGWRFVPAWLDALRVARAVDDGAHFTFVTRYGHVNLDTYDRRRLTLGLNYRPDASRTVFKMDYQLNDDNGSAAGSHDEDVFLLSMATYF